MTFLLLSYLYPTEDQRKEFLRAAGPEFAKNTSSFHKLLPAATSDEGWTQIMRALRQNVDSKVLYTTSKRPVRPNDDNYSAFVGDQWNPKGGGDFSMPPAMAAMMGGTSQQEEEPIPHFDRCACCTKLPTNNKRCSRCKFVLYCSKDCQAQHWKQVHKTSCVPAQETTLEQAMSTNDGFYITPQECQELAQGLLLWKKQQQTGTETSVSDEDHDNIIGPFATYFEFVGEHLNGCFVL